MSLTLAYFENWIDPSALDVLATAPDVVTPVRLSFEAPDADTWATLESAHGLHCRTKTELPEKWYAMRPLIERCPNLLALSSTGAGFDMIDVSAATEAGILVVNNSGTNSVSVAQHALGQMLALSKQMIQADKAMRREAAVDRFLYEGDELTGKTLGIVGLGNIGRRVAAYGPVFGMRVLAYDPYLTDQDFAERGAEPVGFDELFRQSDFVSVHCPLTAETQGMIGEAAFALMKPTAYFLTTARGGVVDEAALVAALAAGNIKGAAVDVLEVEPNGAAHPLARFDNVLLTPHHAGITREANLGMAQGGAQQWIEIFSGRRPPRVVNPEAWESYTARFERIVGRRVA